MMKLNALTTCDFYKTGHMPMYPSGTQFVYTNMTPRSLRLCPTVESVVDNRVVFIGLYGMIQWFLIDTFNESFFNQPKEKVLKQYKRRMDNALGPDAVSVEHIAELHDLGYLPLEIMALPEGAKVDAKVPVFTIHNTLPQFFWLVNYLETVFSNSVWKSMVTATIAYRYRQVLEKYAEITGTPLEIVDIQAHDFSCRGMSGPYDAQMSGLGHLTQFVGTDTVSAIDYAEDYYNADSDKELVGCSVPATEHSVMCMGGKETEIETFRRMLNLHPEGIISIVSDTWDFWKVITEYALELKDDIMNRQPNALGLCKTVFRPDSGDPVKILTGWMMDEYEVDSDGEAYDPSTGNILSNAELKGAVACLYEIFGGTKTDTGHIMLDEHVGLIYGDSITLERCERICQRLAEKGFATGNVVFGIGSYTYQYNTRDTIGAAMKATYGMINGEAVEIYKDPKTDSGVKKSAKGLLMVKEGPNGYELYDQVTMASMRDKANAMKTVFKDGKILRHESLSDIRARVKF